MNGQDECGCIIINMRILEVSNGGSQATFEVRVCNYVCREICIYGGARNADRQYKRRWDRICPAKWEKKEETQTQMLEREPCACFEKGQCSGEIVKLVFGDTGLADFRREQTGCSAM